MLRNVGAGARHISRRSRIAAQPYRVQVLGSPPAAPLQRYPTVGHSRLQPAVTQHCNLPRCARELDSTSRAALASEVYIAGRLLGCKGDARGQPT